jgi:hypothetical protein
MMELTMFQCDYCGAQFLEHQTTCPKCGALMKVVASVTRTTLAAFSDILRAICIKYDGTPNLYLDDSIRPQRLATARERFNVPSDEVVVMLYDDTLFGNNRLGFAICSDGLYWHNDWSVPSRRRFLAWPAFAERTIVLDNRNIILGRGDQIGMAGMGDKDARAQVVAMLNEIKAFQQGL